MAKFCTKCGKKLEEGKACDCEKTTSESVKTAVANNKTLPNFLAMRVLLSFYSFILNGDRNNICPS